MRTVVQACRKCEGRDSTCDNCYGVGWLNLLPTMNGKLNLIDVTGRGEVPGSALNWSLERLRALLQDDEGEKRVVEHVGERKVEGRMMIGRGAWGRVVRHLMMCGYAGWGEIAWEMVCSVKKHGIYWWKDMVCVPGSYYRPVFKAVEAQTKNAVGQWVNGLVRNDCRAHAVDGMTQTDQAWIWPVMPFGYEQAPSFIHPMRVVRLGDGFVVALDFMFRHLETGFSFMKKGRSRTTSIGDKNFQVFWQPLSEVRVCFSKTKASPPMTLTPSHRSQLPAYKRLWTLDECLGHFFSEEWEACHRGYGLDHDPRARVFSLPEPMMQTLQGTVHGQSILL